MDEKMLSDLKDVRINMLDQAKLRRTDGAVIERQRQIVHVFRFRGVGRREFKIERIFRDVEISPVVIDSLYRKRCHGCAVGIVDGQGHGTVCRGVPEGAGLRLQEYERRFTRQLRRRSRYREYGRAGKSGNLLCHYHVGVSCGGFLSIGKSVAADYGIPDPSCKCRERCDCRDGCGYAQQSSPAVRCAGIAGRGATFDSALKS